MDILIDLQYAEDLSDEVLSSVPEHQQMLTWINAALAQLRQDEKFGDTIEISIRIVSEDESQQLNSVYRNKHYPTNVLSFVNELPDYIESFHIGDLVVCAKVVETEAKEQNKGLHHHWAHMLIHGLLHLLGFDHIDQTDAEEMESIEVIILNQLGIDDPYTTV